MFDHAWNSDETELGDGAGREAEDGTRRLRTGDICRMDGTAGIVTVIEPAAG